MTLTSGNTIGTRVWNDGKQFAPMLPRPHPVVKCQHCHRCYWLADARQVGEFEERPYEARHVDPAWTAAPSIGEPAEKDYYKALREGMAVDAQQERTLRILAWWRRNDAFREALPAGRRKVRRASGACRKNLEALAGLLDEEDEDDRIMKAEVLRELGEFESAKLVLSRVTSVEFASVVRQLNELCDSRDAGVKELQFEG